MLLSYKKTPKAAVEHMGEWVKLSKADVGCTRVKDDADQMRGQTGNDHEALI